MTELNKLVERARTHVMTKEEEQAQARSFAYGNAAIDNPLVTKDMVSEAQRLEAERWERDFDVRRDRGDETHDI